MIEFIAAVFFLIITPGPGVLSAAGVGASHGARAGAAYVTGLFLGNNVVMLAVVSGLAALVLTVPLVAWGLGILSIAYLCYLALKIAFSGKKLGFIHPEKAPGVWNGFALQPINPKAYAVNTAFFSNFAFVDHSAFSEAVLKFILINAVWVPIHIVWLAAGIMVRRMDLPDRVQFAVNIAMALSMLAVVALAIYTQL